MEPKASRLILLLWVGMQGITVFSNFQCCEEKIDSMKWSEVKCRVLPVCLFLHCHQPSDTLHVFVLVTFGANTSRVRCSISSAYRKQPHGKMSALQSLWIKLVGEWCKRNDVLFHPVNCMMLACLPLLQSSSFLVYQDNNNSGPPLEGRIQPQQW